MYTIMMNFKEHREKKSYHIAKNLEIFIKRELMSMAYERW